MQNLYDKTSVTQSYLQAESDTVSNCKIQNTENEGLHCVRKQAKGPKPQNEINEHKNIARLTELPSYPSLSL